jgi:hypothetical protein
MLERKNERFSFKELIGIPEKIFTDKMQKVTSEAVKTYNLKLNKKGLAIDCEADAFRHAYMQWWIAFRYGTSLAKYLGDRHEHGNNPDIRRDTNMDLWNNQIGREIANEMLVELRGNFEILPEEYVSEIAKKKIIEKIRNGELITDPSDKRSYKNMELERLKHEDKVYSKEEYEKLFGEEKDKASKNFIDFVIDHDWKIPTKVDLDKQVESGNLIYVGNYTRSDRVKVSGYYRRKPYYKNYKNK